MMVLKSWMDILFYFCAYLLLYPQPFSLLFLLLANAYALISIITLTNDIN